MPVGDEALSLNPALLAAITERDQAGAATFYLVLPDPARHAELTAARRRDSHARGDAMLQQALSRLSEATGRAAEGSVSVRHDPMDVIEETLRVRDVDEIMLALCRHAVSERLHLDLPRRVEHLGIPVTTVMVDSRARQNHGRAR